MERYQSSLTNIWGMKGCTLPSGENCDACCSVLGIEDKNWGKQGFVKGIDIPCRFQGSAKGIEPGCGIYGFHPDSCDYYHCSQSPQKVQLLLVDEAQKLELVSSAEAEVAIERINSQRKASNPPSLKV